jgi:hypothetical protein
MEKFTKNFLAKFGEVDTNQDSIIEFEEVDQLLEKMFIFKDEN